MFLSSATVTIGRGGNPLGQSSTAEKGQSGLASNNYQQRIYRTGNNNKLERSGMRPTGDKLTAASNSKADLKIGCEPQSATNIQNSSGISPMLPLNQLTATVESNNNYGHN